MALGETGHHSSQTMHSVAIGPRQAAAAIVERGAQADRLALLAHADHPAFFLGRNLPDGAGGADLGAEHATGLAIADARHQRRRPEALQPGLLQRGMQRIVGANLHALAAADAAREKIRLVERARRAQQPFVAALAQAGVGAHQRNHGGAGSEAGQRPAAAQIRRGHFMLVAEEAEFQAVVRATAHAVHAHQALGFAPRRAADGVVAALAVEQAAIAFVAGGGVLVQAEDRPAGDRAQQRAQRADRPAPEPRNAQAGRKNREKENAQHQALRKVGLAEVEHRGLQNRVQRFAGRLDGGDVAVLQRRKHARARRS